tara:strand:- start:5793 stop:6347 length:555 start_codon:yes stop_codon:yes gene_type:complete
MDQSLLELLKNAAQYDSETNRYIFDNVTNIVTEEPKKPKNPFFLFKEKNKEKIKKYIEDCPDFSGQGSFSSAASDIWKTMSLEDKLVYEEEYSNLKQEYVKNKKSYDNTFGRFNFANKIVEKPKKRGRPRKIPLSEETESHNGYKSLVIDDVKYELEIETNVLWDENRDEAVGQKVGPKKYEFY